MIGEKLNFLSGERVRVKNVEGLNNTIGRIVGVASRGLVDVYIVELMAPIFTDDFGDHTAIAMPEYCLEKIHSVWDIPK